MTATITLDQIVNAVTSQFPDASPQAQGAGIAAAIQAINDASKKPVKKAATIAPRKSANKAKGTTDFWAGPASDGQIARYNRLETALNAHYGDNCALSVKADFANAKDCSVQYAELAKVGKSLGLNWAA
jgi:hypothetical protein